MVEKILKKTITSKKLLKKQPRETYKIEAPAEYSRSSFFNKEYEREKNIIKWS